MPLCQKCEFFFDKNPYEDEQIWYNHICKAVPGEYWKCKCSKPGCHDKGIREFNCREINKGTCLEFKPKPIRQTFLSKILKIIGVKKEK